MNKVVYAAGTGAAAAAIAIFFLLGAGNLRFPGGPGGPAAQETPLEIQLAIKDIIVTKTDERNADVEIVFSVHNPNKSTAILETIHYNIHVDRFRMTFGDIGTSPEGFLASQEGIFPIVANRTVTLKDERVAVRNNANGAGWDSMVAGTASYSVSGTYSYRLTRANLETMPGEKEFTMTFP